MESNFENYWTVVCTCKGRMQSSVTNYCSLSILEKIPNREFLFFNVAPTDQRADSCSSHDANRDSGGASESKASLMVLGPKLTTGQAKSHRQISAQSQWKRKSLRYWAVQEVSGHLVLGSSIIKAEGGGLPPWMHWLERRSGYSIDYAEASAHRILCGH